MKNHFLSQLTTIVEGNLSNNQFGVSELAKEMNMSRSNLLRKVKNETNLSVSQLIRQIRLKRGMELLKESSHNVSEVAFEVGFSSSSYFIKCFREQYGYPPGDLGNREQIKLGTNPNTLPKPSKRNLALMGFLGLILLLSIGSYFYLKSPVEIETIKEKSIAVLPFKNESNDSTNIYFINGLMESTLSDLQKIKDLKVISRTSVEKYRNNNISISEVAQELNVNYIVEGSGQKIGDQILLNIQLIDASSDKHLWAKQYRKKADDIFDLQQEVAKNIAQEIKAIITPEEELRIEKTPTENLAAYDLFLKGKDLLVSGNQGNLKEAISFFNKAIELDNEFALAYADIAIAHYYLDIFQSEKKFTKEVDSYADKSLLYDSQLTQGLLAKALSFMQRSDFENAIPYLDKALEYHPNSVVIINLLSHIYANYIPNTSKYIEYALKGARLDIASHDSTSVSYIYLHISNALVQSGFLDMAQEYVEKSNSYNSANPFTEHLKIFIEFAKDRDWDRITERLVIEYNKDTTRFDILQDVAKMFYLNNNNEKAFHYFEKFVNRREAMKLDIYKHENLKIAIVYKKMRHIEKANELLSSFKAYADNDKSQYKHISLASYYAYLQDAQKTIEHLKLFSQEDNFQYWILLISDDPNMDFIKGTPEFKSVVNDIETQFWNNHEKIKRTLKEEGL